MSDKDEISVSPPEYSSQKAVIVKWLQVLLVCQLGVLLLQLLNLIPLPGGIGWWLDKGLTAASIIALFNLSPLLERYRKAALFHGISLCGLLAARLLGNTVLSLAWSVCSIVASYQELNAHSELTEPRDKKLSQKWHSLFYLELFSGLLAGSIAMIPMLIASFAGASEELTTLIATICVTAVSVFLNILRLRHLKKTLELYNQ